MLKFYHSKRKNSPPSLCVSKSLNHFTEKCVETNRRKTVPGHVNGPILELKTSDYHIWHEQIPDM